MKGKYYSRLIKLMIFVIDFLLIHLAFRVARGLDLIYGIPEYQFISFFLIFAFVWIIAGFFNKIYRVNSISITKTLSTNLFNTALIHVTIISLIMMFFPLFRMSLTFVFFIYVTATIFIVSSRIIYKLIVKYFEFTGFDQHKVVIVGLTRSGKAIHEFLVSHKGEGYLFKGFFDDDVEVDDPQYKNLMVGGVHQLRDYCVREKIDEIYFTLPLTAKNEALIEKLSRFADDNFIYFRISPDFSNVVHDNYSVFLINS